jgi:hypothetical protein
LFIARILRVFSAWNTVGFDSGKTNPNVILDRYWKSLVLDEVSQHAARVESRYLTQNQTQQKLTPLITRAAEILMDAELLKAGQAAPKVLELTVSLLPSEKQEFRQLLRDMLEQHPIIEAALRDTAPAALHVLSETPTPIELQELIERYSIVFESDVETLSLIIKILEAITAMFSSLPKSGTITA